MKSHLRLALVATVLVLAGYDARAAQAKPQHTRIDLDDRSVEAWIDQPKGEGPHPFLILAADSDGDAKDAANTKIASAAVAEGWVAFRFKPSADPTRGTEEFGAVIGSMIGSRMMKQFEIDTGKVALIAKGNGAKLAMAADSGGTSDKVKAVLLMNPVCESGDGAFAKAYAPFLSSKTPRMIAAAKGGACDLPQIYAAAKDFGDSVALYAYPSEASDAVLPAVTGWIRSLGWSVKTTAKSAKKPDAKKHAHDAQAAGTHP